MPIIQQLLFWKCKGNLIFLTLLIGIYFKHPWRKKWREFREAISWKILHIIWTWKLTVDAAWNTGMGCSIYLYIWPVDGKSPLWSSLYVTLWWTFTFTYDLCSRAPWWWCLYVALWWTFTVEAAWSVVALSVWWRTGWRVQALVHIWIIQCTLNQKMIFNYNYTVMMMSRFLCYVFRQQGETCYQLEMACSIKHKHFHCDIWNILWNITCTVEFAIPLVTVQTFTGPACR